MKQIVSGIFRSAALFCLCLAGVPPSALAAEEDQVLLMFYGEQDVVVTPGRSPRSIFQVAENVTVVTSEEIAAMNGHTLTDILYQVTGLATNLRGGPGTVSETLIQGSDRRHVRVVMDGVSLNNLSDNVVDTSAIPIQQIERVEIIKGPASSAWGSSLGGIVNVITKSPDYGRRSGGTVSASGGERGTGDVRAEVSGSWNRVGYYLTGGGLTSDGLTTNTGFDGGSFYGKLQVRPSERLLLQYTQSYSRGKGGDGTAFRYDLTMRNEFEYLFSTLGLTWQLPNRLELFLDGRLSNQHASFFATRISSGQERLSRFDDTVVGGSAKLHWESDAQDVVLGADMDDGRLKSNRIRDGRQELEKWALYANDTITLGSLSVTAGGRFDHTSTNGSTFSPSLGLAWSPEDLTVVRAYTAKGFNTPPLSYTFGDGLFSAPNPDLGEERIRSFSVGLETSRLRYLWLKTTLFLHDTKELIERSGDLARYVNGGRQRRQGIEAELKSMPVHQTSLLAGYTFTDATDRETGGRVPNIPRQTWQVGLLHDNEHLRAALRGNLIWWNADARQKARYSAMIWDFNIGVKLAERRGTRLEAFLTAHNIFNGSQYLSDIFPNPNRWFESGLKCTF